MGAGIIEEIGIPYFLYAAVLEPFAVCRGKAFLEVVKAIRIRTEVFDLLPDAIGIEFIEEAIILRVTSASGIGLPLVRIRSRRSTKCGLVYNPTLSPEACSAAAIRCEVEPFPLVPAT